MNSHRQVIGVIGSGSQTFEEFSLPLGLWIARQGFNLVNGGGGGVMETVSKGFKNSPKQDGIVLGIIPSVNDCTSSAERNSHQAPSGYPNPYIDIVVKTHLPLSGRMGKDTASRNHIVVLTADIVIALPGSEGTQSEIELCMEYNKPLVILNINKVWNRFLGTSATVVDSLDGVYQQINIWTKAGPA